MAEGTGQTMGGGAPPRPGEVAPAVDTVETVDLTITPDDEPAAANGSTGTGGENAPVDGSDEPAVGRTGRATRFRGGRRLSTGHEIYWWVEIGIVLVFDLIYETVRNMNHSGEQKAYDNALRIIDWQKAIGIYWEEGMQQWALHYEWLIIAANYFYGSAYIGVTIFALIFLYRRFPDAYPLWRNTLLVGTLLGLIGFATFPLMPPRLLDTVAGHAPYGYIDTLVKFPTFWSFDSSAMKTISNQYAAMPSLHCGWALWGCAVFLPRVRSWWAKTLAILYPIVTITVVVITANHYLLDAVGGAFIFLVGYVAARVFTRAGRVPHPKRGATPNSSVSASQSVAERDFLTPKT